MKRALRATGVFSLIIAAYLGLFSLFVLYTHLPAIASHAQVAYLMY